MTAIPLAMPVYAVHGKRDKSVPMSQAESCVAAATATATATGATAELVVVPGDHFAVITPGSRAWSRIVELLDAAAG